MVFALFFAVSIVLSFVCPADAVVDSSPLIYCDGQADRDVLLEIRFKSSVSGDFVTIASKYETREGAINNVGWTVFRMKDRSDFLTRTYFQYSHFFPLDFVGICEPLSDDLTFNSLMGLAGLLSGGLLFYGILSAYLN